MVADVGEGVVPSGVGFFVRVKDVFGVKYAFDFFKERQHLAPKLRF